MQRYTKLEVSVGVFVLLGMLALAYFSLTLGELRWSPVERYVVGARFSSVGGLKKGDPVKVAGVNVGEVHRIALADFNADVTLSLDRELRLPADTIASIQTAGLLGDAYVSLSPGGSERDLLPGGRISRTEPAISIMDLIAKYALGEGPVEHTKRDDGHGADEAPKVGSPFSDPLE